MKCWSVMWTSSSQNVSRLEDCKKTLQPISVRVSKDVLTYNVTIVVVFLWYTPDGVYVPSDRALCSVHTGSAMYAKGVQITVSQTNASVRPE